jgi:hypothetical protein
MPCHLYTSLLEEANTRERYSDRITHLSASGLGSSDAGLFAISVLWQNPRWRDCPLSRKDSAESRALRSGKVRWSSTLSKGKRPNAAREATSLFKVRGKSRRRNSGGIYSCLMPLNPKALARSARRPARPWSPQSCEDAAGSGSLSKTQQSGRLHMHGSRHREAESVSLLA